MTFQVFWVLATTFEMSERDSSSWDWRPTQFSVAFGQRAWLVLSLPNDYMITYSCIWWTDSIAFQMLWLSVTRNYIDHHSLIASLWVYKCCGLQPWLLMIQYTCYYQNITGTHAINYENVNKFKNYYLYCLGDFKNGKTRLFQLYRQYNKRMFNCVLFHWIIMTIGMNIIYPYINSYKICTNWEVN